MGRPEDTTTPEQKERAAAMDADIVDLRRQGVPLVEIGRRMAEKYKRTGHGYPGWRDTDPTKPFTKQYILNRWQNAVAAVPAKRVEEHRAELNERLEGFLEQVEAIMRRDHYAHSNGQLIRLDGDPLIDDGPKLQAIAEGRKILTEFRQLNGLTVPVKQELDLGGHVNYTINNVDVSKLT